jgi:hypothetical protein
MLPAAKFVYNKFGFPALISGQRGGEFDDTGLKFHFNLIDWEGLPVLVKEWLLS